MPNLAAVTERLDVLVSEYESAGISRLPPVARLCVILGCSRATLGKAVKTLVASGRLITSTGRGTLVCTKEKGAPVSNEKIVRNDKCDTLRHTLMHDLFNNTFGETRLPTVKELSSRYGVCHRTMHKMLNSLCEANVLVQRNRAFTFAHAVDRPWSTSICLVMLTNNKRILNISARTHEHLRLLEQQCAKQTIKLKILSYSELPPVGSSSRRALLSDSESWPVNLGFLLWNAGIPDWVETLSPFTQDAHKVGKPVAILDEMGADALPMFNSSAVKIVRMAVSERAGRDAAHYLLSRGHRHIAFFHPHQSKHGLNNRLIGLRDVYTSAGFTNAITDYDTEFVAPGITSNEEGFWDTDRRHDLFRITGLSQISAQEFADVRDDFNGSLYTISERTALRKVLCPWFSDALTKDSISAWVFYNDYVAREGILFLAQHGYDVPSRISVLSFDDSDIASELRFTSYNFNGLAAVRSSLDHVLRFRQSRREPHAVIEEMHGYFTERGTVANVYKHDSSPVPLNPSSI